jgi:hypothetical protein
MQLDVPTAVVYYRNTQLFNNFCCERARERKRERERRERERRERERKREKREREREEVHTEDVTHKRKQHAAHLIHAGTITTVM